MRLVVPSSARNRKPSHRRHLVLRNAHEISSLVCSLSRCTPTRLDVVAASCAEPPRFLTNMTLLRGRARASPLAGLAARAPPERRLEPPNSPELQNRSGIRQAWRCGGELDFHHRQAIVARVFMDAFRELNRGGGEAVMPAGTESRQPNGASAAARPRIVIVGGGFAGVAAAGALARCDADVLLIDRRNHHIFQPLLYQVATAVLSPSDVAAPLRQLARRQRNLTVMLGEVTDIDLAARSLRVSSPALPERTVPFDYLIIATGVRPTYFGHDEFAPYAPSLKTLADAEAIRGRILSAYEQAEETEDAEARARALTFVLVGAGPTGVELAASIA